MLKLLMTFLFTVASVIAIGCVYWGFNLFFHYLLEFLKFLTSKMNIYLFAFFSLFIGLAIISIFWAFFKFISGLIVFKLLKISPYKNYATIVILLLSLICTFLAIADFWIHIGWQTPLIGIYGIVVTLMAIFLFSSLANASFNAVVKELKMQVQ